MAAPVIPCMQRAIDERVDADIVWNRDRRYAIGDGPVQSLIRNIHTILTVKKYPQIDRLLSSVVRRPLGTRG